MKRKPTPLLVSLLLLLAVSLLWLLAPDPAAPAAGQDGTASRSERPRDVSLGDREAEARKLARMSPPSWRPPEPFSEPGTPAPALLFPRGENATRRYHEPVNRTIAADLAEQEPAVLAKSPEDGRFHLLPEEIDLHTLVAGRLVFDPAALDRVVTGETSRILAPSPSDEVLTLEFGKIKTRSANTHTLQGHVVGEETTSDVQIVYHDGILHASVARYATGREIEYRILADGHMMVRELDQSSMTAPCGNSSETLGDSLPENLIGEGLEIQPQEDEGEPAGDTVGGRVVDVVVGYDQGARAADGGYSQIEARIIASVDRMTTAFANSMIPNTELMLLGTIEDPDYVFPGAVPGSMSSGDELGDLNSFTDGNLDAVSDYATRLGADFVSFVLKQADGSAGIAYRPGRSSITARTYMTATRITFGHELGHNLGCDHSWGDSSQAYNTHFGWRFVTDGNIKARTIMAYDWGWGNRVPHFANPDVFYNGAATGAPNGYNVQGDATADQRYFQGGRGYSGSDPNRFGFNGANPGLAANNANTINTGGGSGSYGATYASNRATRTNFDVISPVAGAVWERGTTRTVSFNGGDLEDLGNIELYKAGVLHSTIASGLNPATDRDYLWSLPPGIASGSDYMIRVELARNGGTLTADSGMFTIRTVTPRVISQSPLASAVEIDPISQLSLSFNEIMDPATFSVGDDIISFTDPDGTNLKPSVSGTSWSDGNTALNINFTAQSQEGLYELVLGSQIQSAEGVLLDQDSDEIPGEPVEDRYTATFRIVSLDGSLDATDINWSTSGNAVWFPQTTTTSDGIDAAQSGVITDNQNSSLSTTITGPGTLNFRWKVSSEQGWDYLRFFLNGIEQTGSLAPISGEVDWVQKTVTIPSGNNTVEWRYTKDGSVDGGTDAGWLDQVAFTLDNAPEIVVEQPVANDLVDGSATIDLGPVNTGSSSSPVTFTIRNTGNQDLTGLALSKNGTNSADYSLGSLGATTLAPAASTTFTVTFSPGEAGTRTAAIQIASNDADENPFDINLTGTGLGPGTLAVSPSDDLNSSGFYGGPFTPSSQQYVLTNPGSTSIDWTASKTVGWLTLDSTGGTLAAGSETTVTVSINSSANVFTEGTYNDSIAFANTTSGLGDTAREASLTVLGAGPAATGGTITQVGGHYIHTFTQDGADTFAVTPGITLEVDVLIVGGGGGGGSSTAFSTAGGGGGGAGGLVYQTGLQVGGSTGIMVGTRGAAGGTGNTPGSNGSNSAFGTLVALGGGGGSGGNMQGVAGGSGGGSRGNASGGAGQQPGSASGGFGNSGGGWPSGGGDGAGGGGGAGGNAPASPPQDPKTGGPGGSGLAYDISGTLAYYAGGGGGGGSTTSAFGPGGQGGGGDGGNNDSAPAPGDPNTGGGGGGGNNNRVGADGGSGIVIVRYPVPSTPTPYESWAASNNLSGADSEPATILRADGLTNLQKFAFGMNPNLTSSDPLGFVTGGDITDPGVPTVINLALPGQPDDERAVFARLKNHVAAGLTYTVEFSADLELWTASGAVPTVLTDSNSAGDYEAVSVPFAAAVPLVGGGEPSAPKFMRVVVSSGS